MKKLCSVLAFLAALVAGTSAFAQSAISPHTQLNAGGWPFGATLFKQTGNVNNSTDVSIKAAATATYHCLTSIQIVATDSIAADETVRILSNDTVVWQWFINTTTTSGIAATFPVPICTVAGEALEIDTAGDPADNIIFYNVQGYSNVGSP